MARTRLLPVLLSLAITSTTSQFAAGQTAIVGFDFSGLPGGTDNFGPSPFAATTTAPGITSDGLVRGSGVVTTGTGRPNALGGTNFNSGGADAAATAGQFFTFTVKPTAGTTVSYSSLSRLTYYRSGSGPTTGELQYSVRGADYALAVSLNYTRSVTVTTLSDISFTNKSKADLQDATSTVTFRVVNFGGTQSNGSFYFHDAGAGMSADDFVISGTVVPVPEPTTIFGLATAGLGAFRLVRRRVVG